MARTGVLNIGTNARDVRKSQALMPYSRVIVTVDEETEYVAGNASGMTLEVVCPWGSQAMANNILTAVQGYQYQPYTVAGAIVDPAAEMGDAMNANSVYGGIYQQDVNFGSTYYSDLSAPEDEQLDHEFTYESPVERRITRQAAQTKAEFRITNNALSQEVSARQADSTEFRASLSTQAREISARVTQRGGNNSSFGWSLLSDSFTLYSGNKAVFTCNNSGISVDGNITARTGYIGNGTSGFTIGNYYIKNGKDSPTDSKQGVFIGTKGIGVGTVFSVDVYGNLSIRGKITATSGYIGNGAIGFEIGSTYIRNGMTSYSDRTNNGIYVGTDGIALGKGNFRVDSSGNLYANNGTFNGTIRADKIYGQIVGNQIANGAVGGNQIADGAVGGTQLANSSVTETKLNDDSVSGTKIKDNAVTGTKIKDKTVSKSKTSDGVQTSLDNGDAAKAAFNSLTAGSVMATKLWAGNVVTTDASLGTSRGGKVNIYGQQVRVYSVKDTSGATHHVYGYT